MRIFLYVMNQLTVTELILQFRDMARTALDTARRHVAAAKFWAKKNNIRNVQRCLRGVRVQRNHAIALSDAASLLADRENTIQNENLAWEISDLADACGICYADVRAINREVRRPAQKLKYPKMTGAYIKLRLR